LRKLVDLVRVLIEVTLKYLEPTVEQNVAPDVYELKPTSFLQNQVGIAVVVRVMPGVASDKELKQRH